MRRLPSEQWNLKKSYTKLPKLFFTRQSPIPVPSPRLIIFNNSLGASLGVPLQTEIFAGNVIPEGAEPLAQAYAGHQFGYFTMLGDGRALLLGEQMTSSGEYFDIQIKGSGRTPYSRGGETIDYGPCAFMDTYHPDTVFSSIDKQGRYMPMIINQE